MNTVKQIPTHDEGTHSWPIGSGAGATNFIRVGKVLGQWSERAIQRRQLSDLTAQELEDIGISVGAAITEAAKPFWRA